MKKKELMSKLRKAQEAIKAAMKAIEFLDANADVDQPALAVGTCAFCGKPIEPGQKLHRGIHANCYHLAHNRVIRGEITWAELETNKLIGPPGKSGRPRRAFPSVAENPRNYEVGAQKNQKKKKQAKHAPHADDSHE